MANQKSQASVSQIDNSHPVIIGGYFTSDLTPIPHCMGAMADIRIYDRVLSEEEVDQLARFPEPASLLLLAMGGLAVVRRRRR